MKINRVTYFILGLLLAVVVKAGWPFFYKPFFDNLSIPVYTGILLAYLMPAVVILLLVLIIDFVLDKEKLNIRSVVLQKIILFLLIYTGLSFIFYYFLINFW
jgi:hypothetical protein